MKKKTKKFGNKVAWNSQKQASQGSQYGYMNLPKGISVFKEDPGGRTALDFLCYEVTDPKHPDRDDDLEIAVPGELWYKRPFKVHRQIGPSKESAVCPTSIGKRCPICDYRQKRLQEGAPKKETDGYKASARNLYVVVPKDMKDYDEKPHIWNISQAMFQNLLNTEVNEDPDEYGVFPDHEEGLTVKIRFDSKTIGSSKPFAEANRIDFEERDSQYGDDIISEVPNLDKVLSIPSFSELESKFFELEDEGTPDEPTDQDEPPFDPEDKPEPVRDDAEVCVACEGTGTNSKGRECRICEGTGMRPEKKEEKEPPKKPTKGKKKDKEPEPKKETKKSKGPECPFGHTYATDCEEFDDCDECDLWSDCLDAKES